MHSRIQKTSTVLWCLYNQTAALTFSENGSWTIPQCFSKDRTAKLKTTNTMQATLNQHSSCPWCILNTKTYWRKQRTAAKWSWQKEKIWMDIFYWNCADRNSTIRDQSWTSTIESLAPAGIPLGVELTPPKLQKFRAWSDVANGNRGKHHIFEWNKHY